MSDYTNDEVVPPRRDSGTRRVLQKPFTPIGLVTKVRAAFAANTDHVKPSELG